MQNAMLLMKQLQNGMAKKICVLMRLQEWNFILISTQKQHKSIQRCEQLTQLEHEHEQHSEDTYVDRKEMEVMKAMEECEQ